jgi:hypothetical protein
MGRFVPCEETVKQETGNEGRGDKAVFSDVGDGRPLVDRCQS